MCCVQTHTLACLSDVVDYFVAKVGPSARPLQVDVTTLVAPTTSSRAQHSHSGAGTLDRTPLSHSTTTSVSSPAFTQFVYSNHQAPRSGVGSRRSSLGSSGQSDTRSVSPPSPTDNALNTAAGPVVSGGQTATATQDLSGNSINSLSLLSLYIYRLIITVVCPFVNNYCCASIEHFICTN